MAEGEELKIGTWGIEAMLTAIIQSANDAIVSKDLNGIVTSWNPAAERIFGYTAEEMIGQPILRLIPSDRRDEEPAILERIRLGERIEHFETLRIRKDGCFVNVSVTISPIHGPDGNVIGASKIARDTTDQIRMATELQARTEQIEQQNEELALQNEELEAQNLELEEADRQKNRFLAMLAHELRNPLAPIVNAVHLLQSRKCDDLFLLKQHGVIERQVRQMSRLLDDLLEVSRVTHGLVTLQMERLDLAQIVHEAVQGLEDYTAEKGHHLCVDLPFSPVFVKGDSTRLHQIVSNLMSNAVKFTDPGGEIRVTLTSNAEWAELRVQDSGCGMVVELLPRVFDLFTQAEQGLARSRGGMGVGLTIVRNLLEMHGGSIEARSEGPGKGSEFIVVLPLDVHTGADSGKPEPSQRVHPAAAGTKEKSGSLRVLVVEDNPDTANTLGELLEVWGYKVRIANDGLAALALTREESPDVVLLDLGMPGLNGYEVAEQLRQKTASNTDPQTGLGEPDAGTASVAPAKAGDAARPTPVLIALTGYGQAEDRRRTQELGFAHHLTKPVDPELLNALLKQHSR